MDRAVDIRNELRTDDDLSLFDEEESLRTEIAERRLELLVESVENLAHDLGNALMSLTNYADLAVHEGTAKEQQERYLAELSGSACVAIELVRHLRSVASTGGGELRTISPGALVAPAVAAVESGMRNRRVAFSSPSAYPEVTLRCRVDEAIHAVVDMLDVARHSAIGSNRKVSLEIASSEDAVVVRVRVSEADTDLDPLRLAVLRALASRAGASLDLEVRARLVLSLAFVRAD